MDGLVGGPAMPEMLSDQARARSFPGELWRSAEICPGERCPLLVAGGWNKNGFKVPSKPNQSGIAPLSTTGTPGG